MGQKIVHEMKRAAEYTPEEAASAYILKCAANIAYITMQGGSEMSVESRARNLAMVYDGVPVMLPQEMSAKIAEHANAHIEASRLIAALPGSPDVLNA